MGFPFSLRCAKLGEATAAIARPKAIPATYLLIATIVAYFLSKLKVWRLIS
jgi:hypothetical protein